MIPTSSLSLSLFHLALFRGFLLLVSCKIILECVALDFGGEQQGRTRGVV